MMYTVTMQVESRLSAEDVEAAIEAALDNDPMIAKNCDITLVSAREE